jgi:hypothetical protein
VVQRVLDLDLDFFVDGAVHYRDRVHRGLDPSVASRVAFRRGWTPSRR